MDYITINTKSIPYPNDFTMEEVPNIVGQIQLMNGNIQADVNGWRYADTTLQWDTLLDADLQNLLVALSDDTFNLTFTGIDGTSKTVLARKESRVYTKTRYKHNGNIVWRDIQVKLSFPTCYR